MKNSKSFLKTGCLLPAGIVVAGLVFYFIWSTFLGPRLAASGGCDREAGCLTTAVNGNRSVRVLGYSPDGARFLTDGSSDAIIHDAANGQKITGLDVGREDHQYAVSGDRSQIVAFRSDSLKFFDWDGELRQEMTPGTDQGVLDVTLVPLFEGFAIANKAGVSLWDSQGELVTWLAETGGIKDVAASADGRYLTAYNFVDDELTVWPLQDLDSAVTFSEVEALTIQLSDDGSLVMAGGPGGAFVWRTADGSLLTSLEPDGLKATAAGLSSDGALLGVGYENGAVTVLDLANDELAAAFSLQAKPNRLVFAPDNHALAVGLSDEAEVSGGELIFKNRPAGQSFQPGDLLRTDENRIRVKPGYALVLSLSDS